jgi:hypothetical protein
MKMVKRQGMSKKLTMEVSKREAIRLIATISNQLAEGMHPSGRTEMISDQGEFFDILVDFTKE